MENQELSYDEIVKAYNKIAFENNQLRQQLQAMTFDRTAERLKLMMEIIEKKDVYEEKVVKLADWHMKQILAKN